MINKVAAGLIGAGFRVTLIGDDIYVGLDNRETSQGEVESALAQIFNGREFYLEHAGREVRIFNI